MYTFKINSLGVLFLNFLLSEEHKRVPTPIINGDIALKANYTEILMLNTGVNAPFHWYEFLFTESYSAYKLGYDSKIILCDLSIC